MVFDLLAKQGLDVGWHQGFYAGDEQVHQIMVDFLQHRLVFSKVIVLG